MYKAYPLSLKKSVEEHKSLHANRRGIVPLHGYSDKPTVTPSELIQFRRLGLSYKQIGKKLGVDPHNEDVLQVYHAIQDATGLDVENVQGPSKVSPTNPLWYTFESERDVIASSVLPGKDDVLNLFPQQRIKDRLGEHAGFMLAAYLQVQSIMHEEIVSSINGAAVKSQVGQLKQWIVNLHLSICKSVFSIERAVGLQAFQLSEYWEEGQGRCRCSAVKVIRFGWGCSKYTPQDGYNHDKGIPIISRVVGLSWTRTQKPEASLLTFQIKNLTNWPPNLTRLKNFGLIRMTPMKRGFLSMHQHIMEPLIGP